MNNTETALTLSQAIRKSAIGLAIFAFFTAGIISVTQYLTKEAIVVNEKAFEARLLLSLLPEGFEAEQLLESAQKFSQTNIQQLSLLNVSADEVFYRATNIAGELEAILLPVIAPEGYTEAIRLIIGVSPKGDVIGVRVTKHKETPGLGDQIELSKSNWILNFNGKSLISPEPEKWQVKKDGGEFDQLTGATISPRAVVKAVNHSLQFFELNKDVLLGVNNER